MSSLGPFRKRGQLSSFQIIIFGFLLVVITGTLLLMLPISTKTGHSTNFIDALFTATSSACVTGLIVKDTAIYWSVFGQSVILILIQIGGMGVVTVAVAISMISGKKIDLAQRSTMQEAIAAPKVGGIVKLTGFILKMSLAIELIGAAVMSPVFINDFGIIKGLWYSLFHSISSFCNAGFDLMGVRSPFSSLTSYVSNPTISLTVCLLIIVGGIGFLTWDDIKTHKIHISKYRLQSKVILLTTAVLIVIPALYFYFYEFSASNWAYMSNGERLLASVFQAVTPRTAGFNTVDLNALGEPGQMLTIILMLIGGSPGSTAGGMKTTTVAVLLFATIAVFKRRDNAQCLGRRISDSAVKNAAVIFTMYIVLFLTGGIVISCLEKLPMLTTLFETASAIGTVGLTLGITPTLCTASKIILTLLMFFGRVGGLTLIFAFLPGVRSYTSKYPQEKITIG